MPAIPLPLSGSCRCGRVEIRVSKPPLATSACHCRGCQKMSSSAYSLTAIIPAEGFAVTKGEPVIGGLHGADTHHFFCPHCMTWMFTRGEGMDWFVNVRPTMLDDASWFRPFMETYTSTKLAFAETGAVRSFAGAGKDALYLLPQRVIVEGMYPDRASRKDRPAVDFVFSDVGESRQSVPRLEVAEFPFLRAEAQIGRLRTGDDLQLLVGDRLYLVEGQFATDEDGRPSGGADLIVFSDREVITRAMLQGLSDAVADVGAKERP